MCRLNDEFVSLPPREEGYKLTLHHKDLGKMTVVKKEEAKYLQPEF